MILCMLDIDWCIYSNDQWSFLLQNLPHSFWWITPDSKMIKKIEKVSRIHKWFLHNIQLTSIGFINVPAYEIKSPEQAICDSQKKRVLMIKRTPGKFLEKKFIIFLYSDLISEN